MQKTPIRIGTRGSYLARFQAEMVKKLLAGRNIQSKLVFIDTLGDIDREKSVETIGTGVFTGAVNQAILAGEVDIAVHSCKDLPSELEDGLVLPSVLQRETEADWLLYKKKNKTSIWQNMPGITIATGSVRRKAQWLNRFSHHTVVGLRGNVDTRLKKLAENDWHGAIFAGAGIRRLNIKTDCFKELDFLPAPCQGIIAIICKHDDHEILDVLKSINHPDTFIECHVERNFLRSLKAGCQVPVAGICKVDNDILRFKGEILSRNGKEKIQTDHQLMKNEFEALGKKAADDLILKGGMKLLQKK